MVLRHYGLFAALLFSVLVLSPSGTAHAEPQNEPGPLFMAFKGFCLDTKAQLAAVQAAVRIAPYKIREQPSGAFAPPLTKVSTEAWKFDLGGHRMHLNVGSSTTSDGRRTVRKAAHCSVLSWGDESASMSQALRWLGVTEKPSAAQPRSFHFVWSTSGPKEIQRLAQGQTAPADSWVLVLNQANGYGSLSVGQIMSHHLNAR